MDNYEKIGYSALGILAVVYVIAMIMGAIAAFPFGILALIGFLGIGVLFLKVIKERLNSREDDYYSDNVEK